MSTTEYKFTPFSLSPQQAAANSLRGEAKDLLRRLLGIRAEESNGRLERLVDCLIGCAVYEVAEIQRLASQSGSLDLTPPTDRITL